MGEKVDNIKISIVIPIYNAEKYLYEALDSIKNQTFKNYEVILVDDGSKDKSGKMCDLYCAKDKRFQVIHQDNCGAAIARNNGSNIAKGKYIIFLDADDIFKLDFLEKMYIKAETDKADVCICGYEKIDIYGEVLNTNFPEIKGRSEEEYLSISFLAPWMKLCRRSFLSEKNIRFQNLSSSNDVYYSVCTILDADKITLVQESLIKYRVTTSENQISANRDPRNFGLACELLLKRYTDNYDMKKQTQIVGMCLRGMVIECRYCIDEGKNKALYNFVKDVIISQKNYDYITDKLIKNAICIIKENEYSKELVNDLFSFDRQIPLKDKEKLLRILSNYNKIVLWGIGDRGTQFLRFCLKNDVHIIAITDKKNCDIGQKNSLGYEVIHTSYALQIADLIIACNDVVYNVLKDNDEGIKVLNLQQFI